MVKSCEYFDLILDSSCLVSSELCLIKQLNGNLETWISYIVTEKDFAELARPKNLGS